MYKKIQTTTIIISAKLVLKRNLPGGRATGIVIKYMLKKI
jgi:hypothetical protein